MLLTALSSSTEVSPFLFWSIVSVFVIIPLLFLIPFFVDKYFLSKDTYVWLENGEDLDILRGDHYILIWSLNSNYPFRMTLINQMPDDEKVKDFYRFYLKLEKGYLGISGRSLHMYKRILPVNYLGEEAYNNAWDYYRDRDETINEEIRKYISQKDEVLANPPEDKDNPELWLSNNWIWFLQWEDEKVEFKY